MRQHPVDKLFDTPRLGITAPIGVHTPRVQVVRARAVRNTVLHASEAGQKCNELVTIAHTLATEEKLCYAEFGCFSRLT